ncbi:hypothetical protein TI04_11170, partial [Achromatium sp. WMS2]
MHTLPGYLAVPLQHHGRNYYVPAGFTAFLPPYGSSLCVMVGCNNQRALHHVAMLQPNCKLQGVPTYGTVHLGAVWPGIEVSLSARGNNVEKLFTLAPGADPNAIQLAVAGGELSINTGGS